MKKLIALVLVLVLLLCLAACGNKLVEGSEKTYYGTVTDRAMSVVNEGDCQGRAYISITTDNEDIQFCVPFPVSWTVKMKKKQKETQDILSYHTQAAGCSDKARAKASGGRQPIEECGRTGL